VYYSFISPHQKAAALDDDELSLYCECCVSEYVVVSYTSVTYLRLCILFLSVCASVAFYFAQYTLIPTERIVI